MLLSSPFRGTLRAPDDAASCSCIFLQAPAGRGSALGTRRRAWWVSRIDRASSRGEYHYCLADDVGYRRSTVVIPLWCKLGTVVLPLYCRLRSSGCLLECLRHRLAQMGTTSGGSMRSSSTVLAASLPVFPSIVHIPALEKRPQNVAPFFPEASHLGRSTR